MTTMTIIDRDLALERAGNNLDLARELFSMLLKELPDYRQTIPELYAAGEMNTLLERVHKLNGAATYCGVPELKAAADDFEGRLKRGEEEFEADVEGLVAAIDRVNAAAESNPL